MAIKSTTMSLLFSFVIILILHTNFILIASSQTVNDINGNFLQPGVEYFIVPYSRGIVGLSSTIGLSSNPNGSSCPLGVVLQTDVTKHGLPVKFSPINSKDNFFDVDTNVNIEFSASISTCVTSTVWKIQPSFINDTTQYFVTIGGVERNEFDWFKIESSKSGGYEIIYCPTGCATCRPLVPVCGPIGLINDNGITRLGITSTPLRVSFVRTGL